MLRQTRFKRLLPFLILSALFLQSASLWSQLKTLDRSIEPVVAPGDTLREFINSVPINELAVFAFDAGIQAWRSIPFQIDEKNSSGDFVFPGQVDDISGFDANDEIVFMASDAGDEAFIWLNDPGSEQYPRVEICLRDTLDQQNIKKAWVYVYRSSNFGNGIAKHGNNAFVPLSGVDYISYSPSPNAQTGEDTVKTGTYKIAGNEKGLFGALFLPSDPQADLIDRQKIRGGTNIIDFDEQANIRFVGLSVIDGNVRVVRQLTLKLVVSFIGREFDILDVPLPALYYRDSLFLGGTLSIPAEIKIAGFFTVKIEKIRHSIDLSPLADGALFSNLNNTGIRINATPDVIDESLVFAPAMNFTHIVGSQTGINKTKLRNSRQPFQGTIITLFSLPNTIGDVRKLFYRDIIGEGSPDDDNNSFGDTGVIITGSDIEGEFPLAFNLIFFADNQPVSTAENLTINAENPLELETKSQEFSAVPVELITFTASPKDNDVHLNWVTASETNNFGFEIERRRPALTLVWKNIGFVEGQGTTTVPTEYRFVNAGLQADSYDYRLKQIDTDGSVEFSNVITAVIGLPATFVLSQNFPNPFNPETRIQYELPAVVAQNQSSVRTVLSIYNLLGQKVRTLVDEEQAPGYYSVLWNGKDDTGRQAPSGIYLYRVRSGNHVDTKKMVLVQ
ncbi:MAG: FlgD immunoglobulin-like domain containing protein [bacterium]